MPSSPKKSTSKNFMFGADDIARLSEVKERTGVAGSVIVRHAIAYYWTMLVAGVPICANGASCQCPHLFITTGTINPGAPAAAYQGVPLAPAFVPPPAPPPSRPAPAVSPAPVPPDDQAA